MHTEAGVQRHSRQQGKWGVLTQEIKKIEKCSSSVYHLIGQLSQLSESSTQKIGSPNCIFTEDSSLGIVRCRFYICPMCVPIFQVHAAFTRNALAYTLCPPALPIAWIDAWSVSMRRPRRAEQAPVVLTVCTDRGASR